MTITTPNAVAAATRRPTPGVGVIGGLLAGFGAVVAVVALVLGPQPALLVVAALGGGALLITAALRPSVALALLIIPQFSEAGTVAGMPKSYAGTLGVGLLSALLALREPENRRRMRQLPLAPIALLGIFILAVLPSVVFSHVPSATAVAFEDLLKDCALLVVVLLLAFLVNRPWWVAAVIVLTLTSLSAMAIVNQVALGPVPSAFGGFATLSTEGGELITTPRHAGPLPDPNFWGRYLVLGLPLAYALLHRAGASARRSAQLGWAMATATLLAAVYLTQSRGTMLATVVATVVFVVASGPRMRRRTLLLAPVLAPILLIPGIGNRLLGLDQAFSGQPSYAIDPSLVERTAAQKIGAIVFADNPLFGTGYGTFSSVIHDYASRTGDLLIGDSTATHNLYLGLGADSGVVGLTGWLIMVTGMAALATRSIVRLAGTRPDGPAGVPTRAFAAALLAAVLAWSLASTFLHLAYFRPLLIVFALIGVVAAAAGQAELTQRPAAMAASARAARGLVTGGALGAVVLVVTVASAGLLLTALAEPRYTSVATFTLAPAPNTYEAYAIDVRSRKPVLPAYASMIQGDLDPDQVRVDAEPTRGLITVTAAGASRSAAQDSLSRVVDDAPAALARFGADNGYRLAALSPPELEVETTYPRHAVVITALVVLGELVLVGMALHHLRRPEPRRPACARPLRTRLTSTQELPTVRPR